MPWSPSQAPEHTKQASTPPLKTLWSRVANRILRDTGDEGRALAGAAAAVKREKAGH